MEDFQSQYNFATCITYNRLLGYRDNNPVEPSIHDSDHIRQLLLNEIKRLIHANPGARNSHILVMTDIPDIHANHWLEFFPACCEQARQEIDEASATRRI